MRLIFLFLLMAMLTLGGTSCQSAMSSPTTQNVVAEDATRISLEDAKKDFDVGTAVFVDSRPESAYKSNHIKGAINIPLADAETRWKEIPTDKKIIVYCS